MNNGIRSELEQMAVRAVSGRRADVVARIGRIAYNAVDYR